MSQKEFLVTGEFTFKGTAIVFAENEQEAREKFDGGKYNYLDHSNNCIHCELENIVEN